MPDRFTACARAVGGVCRGPVMGRARAGTARPLVSLPQPPLSLLLSPNPAERYQQERAANPPMLNAPIGTTRDRPTINGLSGRVRALATRESDLGSPIRCSASHVAADAPNVE